MERSNGKVAALFSETYEGDEDDTLNNGASQLARSRCFSFFFLFFFLHAREFHPPGDVFTLCEAKKERCRRNLNLLLDPRLLSQRSRVKMKSMKFILSILYRPYIDLFQTLIFHTPRTPCRYRYKKSLRSRHRRPMSPEGRQLVLFPPLKTSLLSFFPLKRKEKKKEEKSIRFKVGRNAFPERSNTIKLRRIDGKQPWEPVLATDSSPNVDIKSLLGYISVVSKREEGCVPRCANYG